MTTPDASPAPDAGLARVTRPEPERTSPDRSGSAAAAIPSSPAPATTPLPTPAPPAPTSVHSPEELAINTAVAGTVKSAYDVLAETVEQGRKAAEQFRVGAYNVRDVPDDVRALAGNMLGLARQLSSATFDICEALLRQTGGTATPPPPGSTYVAPFPHTPPMTAADRQPDYSNTPLAVARTNAMRLSVRFAGADHATAHTSELARPSRPTAPSDVQSAPLTTQSPEVPPLTGVTFTADLAGGGLIAAITVPPGQPAGVYSGIVTCSTQTLPLGLLVVEIS